MTEKELVVKVAAEVYGVDPEDVVVTPLGLRCAIHTLKLAIKKDNNPGVFVRGGNKEQRDLCVGEDALKGLLDAIDGRLMEAGWFLEGNPLPDDVVEVPLNGGSMKVTPEDFEAVKGSVPAWEWGAWLLVRVFGCDFETVEAMTPKRILQEADYFKDEIDAKLCGER